MMLVGSAQFMHHTSIESDISSDGASVLSLCYSSSSFEEIESSSSNSNLINSDFEQESSVIEPYLYEPEDNNSPLHAESEPSESEAVNRLASKDW